MTKLLTALHGAFQQVRADRSLGASAHRAPRRSMPEPLATGPAAPSCADRGQGLRQELLVRLAAGTLKRRLVGGAVGAFGLKIANTALILCTSALLARLLGAESYGMYALAIACVTLLEVPAQLGLPTLLIRWTAACAATADWPRLRG